MRISFTLSRYFARHYLAAFLIVFSVLVGLAFVFDTVELLRRSAGRSEATFPLVMGMAILKLPALSQKLLPFAALFGGMLALARLTRSNELTVSRAAGVSVWQFLAPALAITLILGTIAVTIYNPVASAMLSRYAELEGKLLRGRTSLLALSGSGLWLRDTDAEGQVVIHALRVAGDGVELYDAIFLFYEGNDRFIRRVDATTARLGEGRWFLENVLVTGPDRPAESAEFLELSTEMTLNRIRDSFAPPETLSFWSLPGFIATLENSGFSALRHRLHFYSTIAVPFLLCAMVLIAAPFSLRLTRKGGTALLMGVGVGAGFILYLTSDLVLALGFAGTLPPLMAAWTPTAVSMLIGSTMLFYLEDG